MERQFYLVLLDLSAAFDHDIMLNRFQSRYGITETALNWFSFNFRGCSNTNFLDFGVPQDSVIGSRSFTMYMAPVGDNLLKHDTKFYMYADGIQIFLDFVPTIPGEAASCLHKLSSCISDVQKWMLRNKLKLNEDKTEFFIASSPHHKQCPQNVTLHVNESSINSVPTVRNLGVMFNDTMTMSQYVSTVCRSVNYHIRNIGKRCKYVTWSRGMSRMSGILILSYRLKEVINSYVLHCFWNQRNIHISATRCPIEMEFRSKCSILNGQVIYIEKSKLNIADMWLIPPDCVTYTDYGTCHASAKASMESRLDYCNSLLNCIAQI